MKGIYLKERLKETGLSVTKIAERLGTSSQNLQMYFKAEDVRTSTLERLSSVLDKPIAWFYSETEYAQPESPTNGTNVLAAQLAEKDRQIERLLGIIEAMQGDAKKGIA